MSTSSVGVKQSCTSAIASSWRGSVTPACAYASRTLALDLGEVGVVVLGVDEPGAVAGDERQRLHVERPVGVAVRVLGPDDDRRRGAVGDARAVEDAERARHPRRRADLLHAHLAPELRPRVLGAVGVVLPRDAGQHLA